MTRKYRLALLSLRIVMGAVGGGLAPILYYKAAILKHGNHWVKMAGPPTTNAIVVWAVIGALCVFAYTKTKSR